MSYSSHQSIYTHFLPEMTHAGAQTLTDDVEFEMKWCERGRLSVYCSTSGKKIDVELRCCWTSWLGLSRSVTHTLSHSLGSSFSLFHLSELMNRCCRAVECRMMDCASGGRSQLGKERERERASEFYDFSAIQNILKCEKVDPWNSCTIFVCGHVYLKGQRTTNKNSHHFHLRVFPNSSECGLSDYKIKYHKKYLFTKTSEVIQ